jgi:hypothetical protein
MSFPLRSPRHLTQNIYILARVIDKIRLKAQGALPEGYVVGFKEGSRTFDDRLCHFLHIDFSALEKRVLEGGTDDEILEWCFQHGRRPSAEEIEVWQQFIEKRGWRDNGTPGLIQQKIDAGIAHRDDIQTYFDIMDYEEGRELPPA